MGGLLLVVSYIFVVPLLVLWVGLRKKRKKKVNFVVQGQLQHMSIN